MPSVELVIGAASIGTAAVVAQVASDTTGRLSAAEEIWGLGLGPFMALSYTFGALTAATAGITTIKEMRTNQNL